MLTWIIIFLLFIFHLIFCIPVYVQNSIRYDSVCVSFREHLVYLDWEAPKGYLDLSEMKVPQDLKDSEEMEENEEASVK